MPNSWVHILTNGWTHSTLLHSLTLRTAFRSFSHVNSTGCSVRGGWTNILTVEPNWLRLFFSTFPRLGSHQQPLPQLSSSEQEYTASSKFAGTSPFSDSCCTVPLISVALHCVGNKWLHIRHCQEVGAKSVPSVSFSIRKTSRLGTGRTQTWPPSLTSILAAWAWVWARAFPSRLSSTEREKDACLRQRVNVRTTENQYEI